ncbi:hypothetical protein ABTX81_34460 [Kitasatospora sp. NPDC097605]|uniref:hypothetical protein n=1 Tax=Kitasatospora sp. NPDC097605 TaxID=3157226 RepID=UPI0033183255
MEDPGFEATVLRVGERRIDVYRALRMIEPVSLWQAECLLDAVPLVLQGYGLEDVRTRADRLRAAGAEVTVSCRACGRSVPEEGAWIDAAPCAEAGWPYCPASGDQPPSMVWYP